MSEHFAFKLHFAVLTKKNREKKDEIFSDRLNFNKQSGNKPLCECCNWKGGIPKMTDPTARADFVLLKN